MKEEFITRYNIMKVSSISEFANIKGGMNRNCKDVYFYRFVGVNDKYLEDVGEMENNLKLQMKEGKLNYKRITDLPQLVLPQDIDTYSKLYMEWGNSGHQKIHIQTLSANDSFNKVLNSACQKVVNQCKAMNLHFNESQEKNFMVKILYWLDDTLKGFINNWDEHMTVKIAVSNVSKNHNYLFFYLLTLLGFDVLLLQYSRDIDENADKLGLSASCVLGPFSNITLPPYSKHSESIKPAVDNKSNHPGHENIKIHIPEHPRHENIKMHIPEHPGRAKKTVSALVTPACNANVVRNAGQAPGTMSVSNGSRQPRTEKTYEELALLASSVVLIAVHDRNGDVIGTGSGIMIGKNGYILTNNHVANGGRFYSVKIEDDEQVYSTDEVIKYNSVLDLAVIRIQKQLKPLPVYNGRDKLVRGQRVVAIGSPLGLFNSVSDGIIAGFRMIDNVDMIQFTAPISHGSSGGAVLNMYGEVVGISTAGIDNGQNINLAMGYECINTFVKGFI